MKKVGLPSHGVAGGRDEGHSQGSNKTPKINMLASWLELDFGGIRISALGVLANFCVKWGNKKVLSAIRISTLGVKRKNVLGAIRISALGVLANFCVKWGS